MEDSHVLSALLAIEVQVGEKGKGKKEKGRAGAEPRDLDASWMDDSNRWPTSTRPKAAPPFSIFHLPLPRTQEREKR